MDAIERRSEVAYVVVRLLIGADSYWLLRWHPKWSDWSLLGGHVEANEREDWLLAAERETDEEMAPLRVGEDVRVVALPVAPTSFVRNSRSAAGAKTQYEVRWFALEFLRDPVECLDRLDASLFALVREDDLRRSVSSVRLPVAAIVRDAVRLLTGTVGHGIASDRLSTLSPLLRSGET